MCLRTLGAGVGVDIGDNARFAEAGSDLRSETREAFGDRRCSLVLLKHGLRVGVGAPPERDESGCSTSGSGVRSSCMVASSAIDRGTSPRSSGGSPECPGRGAVRVALTDRVFLFAEQSFEPSILVEFRELAGSADVSPTDHDLRKGVCVEPLTDGRFACVSDSPALLALADCQ